MGSNRRSTCSLIAGAETKQEAKSTCRPTTDEALTQRGNAAANDNSGCLPVAAPVLYRYRVARGPSESSSRI